MCRRDMFRMGLLTNKSPHNVEGEGAVDQHFIEHRLRGFGLLHFQRFQHHGIFLAGLNREIDAM